MKHVQIYDCTLRDGSQAEGVFFSIEDKLRITEKLDDLAIDYIEGGFPGSNPKDIEFFKKVLRADLKHSTVTAFASTRRARSKAAKDAGLCAVLDAGVKAAAIFGKSWNLHVRDVLRVTESENLRMIEESVAFLKSKGLEIIYDAEHYFDGYRANPEYALQTLRAAVSGGAGILVLCDTNGGCMPLDIKEIFEATANEIDVPLGIHTHNDSGTAVAGTLIAVRLGAVQVQGTINGYGERCGNANLCSVIPSLELKLGVSCLKKGKLKKLTDTSRFVSELANLSHDEKQAYVGHSAFAHKGGMHIDAVKKNPKSFEHIEPEVVGNYRRLLISEVSGRSSILEKATKYATDLQKDSPEVRGLTQQLKQLENEGYQFEAAEGSFDLLIMKAFKKHRKLFERAGFRIIVERREDNTLISEATIKMRLGDKVVHTAAEGDGPVNALDAALRKALQEFYPKIGSISLTDYKVRVLEEKSGTAAKVRVLIESTDHENTWGTVGVSTNIIEASWEALLDSIEYGLLYKRQRAKKK